MAGRFDGDTNLDVVVANYGSSTVGVLLGNGNGSFQPVTNYATAANPIALALGDLNGDSKADLVSANRGANNVSVLLGNGDGTFQTATNYATGGAQRSVAVGDFNGDNRLDVVTANEGKRHQAYAESLGVDRYMLKPVPLERLLDAAVELLDRQAAEEGEEE